MKYLNKECKDCDYLVERYGYCTLIEEDVGPQLDMLSFDWRTFYRGANGN